MLASSSFKRMMNSATISRNSTIFDGQLRNQLVERLKRRFDGRRLCDSNDGRGRARSNGGGDLIEQHVLVNWFRKVGVATGLQTFGGILLQGVGRQGDDGNRQARATQFRRGRVAVHDRHLHVHQDHVERLGQCSLDGLAAVFSLFDLGPSPSQHQPQQLAVGFAIVDDQHAAVPQRRRFAANPVASFEFADSASSSSQATSCQRPGGYLAGKGRAAAYFAVHADPAAQQLGKLPADRQAQASAAELARDRESAWVNRSKIIASLSGGMPMPVSVISTTSFGASPGWAADPDSDSNAPLRSELDRIADEVDQNLAEPRRIAADCQRHGALE